MKPPHHRTRLWVDPAFQLRLLVRMGVYFLVYAVVVWHVGFLMQLADAMLRTGLSKGFGSLYLGFIEQQRPLLYALVLVVPIIVNDLLRFSQRIAGPLYRCRKVMQEMAAGKRVPEFHPRKHDQMAELFEAFNAVIKEWNARVGANGRAGGTNTAEAAAEGMSPVPAGCAAAEPQHLGV